MKTISMAMAVTTLLIFLSSPVAEAQTIVPPTAKKFERRGTGGGGGATVGLQKREPQPKETITITYTAVSKAREWTNTEGKNMTAQLLAFSVPKEGTEGPVEVIKEGKVRFLMANHKKPIDYPLDQLSQPDQIFVKAIAQAASKGTPNPGLAKKEAETEKSE